MSTVAYTDQFNVQYDVPIQTRLAVSSDAFTKTSTAQQMRNCACPEQPSAASNTIPWNNGVSTWNNGLSSWGNGVSPSLSGFNRGLGDNCTRQVRGNTEFITCVRGNEKTVTSRLI